MRWVPSEPSPLCSALVSALTRSPLGLGDQFHGGALSAVLSALPDSNPGFEIAAEARPAMESMPTAKRTNAPRARKFRICLSPSPNYASRVSQTL